MKIKKLLYVWKFAYRHLFFKFWYRLISMLDKNAEVIFMNFGYHSEGNNLQLTPAEEANRYSIHLYHQLVCNWDIRQKDLLEVGCGRGGGLAYINRQFAPAKAVGMDLDKLAIRFCRKHHQENGLAFLAGNAHQLPFEDNSFDCIINVESSHRYENVRQFFQEVHRVLRPNGMFLVTDFRRDFMLEKFHNDIRSTGLILEGHEDISQNVIRAIELDDDRRRDLVTRIAPSFLRKLAMEFAGVKESDVYRNLVSGGWVYVNYFMRKEP